jgi:hypothetical protein
MITEPVVPEPGQPAAAGCLRAQPYDQVNGTVSGGFRRPSRRRCHRGKMDAWLH